jgi:hypothetical protein
MKIHNLLIVIALACVFYSCGKSDTGVSQQNLIVGKWTLQQQHMIITVNSIKQTDSTVNASATNYGNISFDKNGTFTSAGYYTTVITGSLSSTPVAESDSTSGSYTFLGNQFLSAPVAGFILGNSAAFTLATGSYGTTPIYTLVSAYSRIVRLSQSVLTLQTDYMYNEKGQPAVTYENTNVYYYTR